MSKETVQSAFETDLTNPGSQKSGEYLSEHLIQRARSFLNEDRIGVVEALREWIARRDKLYTLHAVTIARELHLVELADDIGRLHAEIQSGAVFLPYYSQWTESALSALRRTD